MKRTAIAWATVKGVLLAYAGWLAVALLFAGVSEFAARVFEAPYAEQWTALRAASRFWTAWWFLIFGVISAPLWLGLCIHFTRYFVRAGYRLVATGYLLVFFGSLGLVASVVYFTGADMSLTTSEALFNLTVGGGMVVIGLLLSRRHAHRA